MRQSYREVGLAAMKILSPEQQEKLIEELDRPEPPPQSPAGKTGGMRKIGVGVSTIVAPSGAKQRKKLGRPSSKVASRP